jgi:hypothetical protein
VHVILVPAGISKQTRKSGAPPPTSQEDPSIFVVLQSADTAITCHIEVGSIEHALAEHSSNAAHSPQA